MGSSTNTTTDTVNNTGNAKVLSATHYDSATQDEVVEIAFNESVDPSGESFVVGFENGSTQEFSNAMAEGSNRVVIPTSELYSNIQNVSVPDSLTSTDEDVSVTFAPTTVNAGDDVDGYVGSNVAFEAGSTDTTIDFDGPSFSPTRGTGAGSYVYVVDTDDFDTGNYSADFSDGGVGYVTLENLGLSVSADDVTTDDDVTATVEADDINRDVDVALLDSDDEEVASDSVTIDSDGSATADFGTQSAGNYTVVATDVATGVEATSAVNVTTAAVGQADLAANTFDVAQGGVAEITVDLSGGATMGTLVIGDVADQGYQANVTFTDENEDGEVTILFNTYNAGAGSTGAGVVEAAGDDSAELNSGDTPLGSNLLAEGGYDLAVDTGHAANGSEVTTSGSSDFGSMSIGPRSTDSLALWTAPGGTSGADVFDATLTEDTTIATNDWVIVQVSATGLEGLVDGNLSGTVGNGVNISVAQTESSTKPNTQAKELDLSASAGAIEYLSDADNQTYFIAINTKTADLERDGSGSYSMSAGEEYVATFTVDDSKLVGSNNESVNSTFEVVEQTRSLDASPVTVTAESGQSISGTSSAAPGTEFKVTVESAGDTSPRFYNNPTATVQADGTWNVTVDFSEQSAGDTFTVSSGSFFDADGEVVESTSTATPTATATAEPDDTATATATATAEPDTDTATATDEPDTETDTETSTETPGFGVAVALVALLAAALLAGRRE